MYIDIFYRFYSFETECMHTIYSLIELHTQCVRSAHILQGFLKIGTEIRSFFTEFWNAAYRDLYFLLCVSYLL